MAEGGEKNKDNPFSFKKFVSPRDKENETTEESEHTMANGQVLDILPDIGDSSNKNRRKERATLVISDDGKLWNIYIVLPNVLRNHSTHFNRKTLNNKIVFFFRLCCVLRNHLAV
jgi:predicted secreted acid phosphatase